VRGTIVYKMTGSGNDFVLLDGRAARADQWSTQRIVQLCDRRTGVGADGFAILTPEAPGTVRMAYWNSDGSRAAMCGNAALCSSRLAVYLELVEPGDLCLHTDAGMVRAHCAPSGDRAEIQLPDFELDSSAPPFDRLAGERWMAFASVGVPHLVIGVDDIETIDLPGRGGGLRHDPRLAPAGANVNFVGRPPAPGGPWLIRTYERGVEGETLACGTGTVAAAVAVAAQGESELPVRFRSRGGRELLVRASLRSGAASQVWLEGEGKLVFRAVWEA
jgi:diaminopimelate epimerase